MRALGDALFVVALVNMPILTVFALGMFLHFVCGVGT